MNAFIPVDNPTLVPDGTMALAVLDNPLPLLDWSDSSLSSSHVDWEQELKTASSSSSSLDDEDKHGIACHTAAVSKKNTARRYTRSESQSRLSPTSSPHKGVIFSTHPSDEKSHAILQRNTRRNDDPITSFVRARLHIFQSNLRFISTSLKCLVVDLVQVHFRGIDKTAGLPHACETGIQVARKLVSSFPQS